MNLGGPLNCEVKADGKRLALFPGLKAPRGKKGSLHMAFLLTSSTIATVRAGRRPITSKTLALPRQVSSAHKTHLFLRLTTKWLSMDLDWEVGFPPLG